jgi:hypothetical protein
MENIPPTSPGVDSAELMPIINQELLAKMQRYFAMLNNPDSGLSPEEAQVKAGKYYAENIAEKYPSTQINIAIGIIR